ncbi:MAG: hypothetical protein AAF629_15910 [Chloroflexota bacterium]
MEIKQDNHTVSYDELTQTIVCSGTFRLRGSDYAPIVELLNTVADAQPELITLDVRQLQFLNSSGINVLSKFVIRVRKQASSKMLILGNAQVPWQKKSLRNLQRLKPDLVLEIE